MGLANNVQLDSIEPWFDRVYPDDVGALRKVIYVHFFPPGKEVVLTSMSDCYMLLIETIHCSLSMEVCIPTKIGQSSDELIGNSISAETTARK
jgi:hypothetical protein